MIGIYTKKFKVHMYMYMYMRVCICAYNVFDKCLSIYG